jgi:hypothetical protein
LDDFPVGAIPADEKEFFLEGLRFRHDLGKRGKMLNHRGTMDTEFLEKALFSTSVIIVSLWLPAGADIHDGQNFKPQRHDGHRVFRAAVFFRPL